MLKKSIFGLLLSGLLFSVSAKNYTPSLGLNLGIGNPFYVDLNYGINYTLGAKKKFIIGTGLRGTMLFGNNLRYISAPATITATPSNVDTFLMPSSNIIATNIFINLGFQINKKLSLQFSIDAIGLSFGGKQNGTFLLGENSQKAGLPNNTTHASKPTGLNILLVGDRDFGTLNSSFTANYKISDKIGLRAGAGFLFSEYTAHKNLGAANNNRFRNKALQGVLGVSYYF